MMACNNRVEVKIILTRITNMPGIVGIDFQKCVQTKKTSFIFQHFFAHVDVVGASQV